MDEVIGIWTLEIWQPLDGYLDHGDLPTSRSGRDGPTLKPGGLSVRLFQSKIAKKWQICSNLFVNFGGSHILAFPLNQIDTKNKLNDQSLTRNVKPGDRSISERKKAVYPTINRKPNIKRAANWKTECWIWGWTWNWISSHPTNQMKN